MTAPPRTRMSADERLDQIVAAATRAFARDGYAGTTTDSVAKEAGISQPYVVRTFGTKLELFLEAFGACIDAVRDAFAAVTDSSDFDPADEDSWSRLGEAYDALITDRHRLMVMMHGFTASSVPQLGARARQGMAEIHATVLRTGCAPDRAREFIAHGMLLNVLVAMQAREHDADGALATLVECSFTPETLAP